MQITHNHPGEAENKITSVPPARVLERRLKVRQGAVGSLVHSSWSVQGQTCLELACSTFRDPIILPYTQLNIKSILQQKWFQKFTKKSCLENNNIHNLCSVNFEMSNPNT